MNPPLRIAIVGCGAMTRDIHLPVLAGHDAFRVVALVDRDLPRAQALARSYQIPKVLCDLETIDRQEADGVLVVTPPGHHAAATLALVRRGFHVLVEKPFALSVDDAEAMVHAADAAGVVLAVGHHRRLYPATRMLRALLQQRPYGDIVSFDIEEGGIYNWPLVSLANLRRDQGGGGVLVDIGCHLLDQLLYCLPGEPLLQNYRDNARGGVETDCAIQLSLRTDREEVAGTVRLSRTCQLRGSIRVECAAATLELVTADRFRVHIHPRGKEMIDPVVGRAAPARLHASWDGIPEEPGRGAYRLEFEDWAQAIRLGTPPILDGRTTVPVVRLIEQCYSQRAHSGSRGWKPVCPSLPRRLTICMSPACGVSC